MCYEFIYFHLFSTYSMRHDHISTYIFILFFIYTSMLLQWFPQRELSPVTTASTSIAWVVVWLNLSLHITHFWCILGDGQHRANILLVYITITSAGNVTKCKSVVEFLVWNEKLKILSSHDMRLTFTVLWRTWCPPSPSINNYKRMASQ